MEIDGKAVDASAAPILFANSVGGYMPSSVADATGVGAGGMSGGAPGGVPSGSASAPGANGNNNATGGATASNQLLALAAGYVVVEPGARGRTLKNSAGEYYGTAPAAIVDLKAAVRYVRYNKGRIPGDVDRIVSAGTSAGGALSALLGASGDSPIYDGYLRELGAADASDAIFATGAWCPITDLEHADGAYEWNWGANATQSTGKVVDQSVSKDLAAQFAEYQASLKLRGLNRFGALTARNYDEYLLEQYMRPSATRYLAACRTPSARRTWRRTPSSPSPPARQPSPGTTTSPTSAPGRRPRPPSTPSTCRPARTTSSARAPRRTVTSPPTARRTTPPGSAPSGSPPTSPRSCT